MRNRLVITLALGVLAAVLAAGVVNAQGTAPAGVKVDLPGGNSVGTACVNGIDDDGDGAADFPADPGCSSVADGDESDAAPAPPSTTTQSTTTTPSTTTPSTTTPSTTTTTPSTTGGDSDEGDEDVPTTKDPFGDKGNKGGNHEKTFKGDKREKKDASDEGSGNGDEGSVAPAPLRKDDGTPTRSNPTITIGSSGAAPIGVPNFVIDQFSIPPFLIPIYQACGTQYGIPWEVLASINRIETAFGTNLNVSSAGALGWMQFMPGTWQMYGVDANNDGRKDPYNPVDAICAAARYLNAAGGRENLYDAIFAYNHADWYVQEVLLYAKQYGDLPGVLVDAMAGITEGAHFPVAAKARYADDISERAALRRARPHKGASGNAADVVSDSPTRRGIDIYSKRGAPVVAVNDGVITRIGQNKKLGKFIVLRDAYGNEYTYAELGSIAKTIPAPRKERLTARDFDLVKPRKSGDAKPKRQASATTRRDAEAVLGGGDGKQKRSSSNEKRAKGPINTEDLRPRIAASETGAGGFEDLLSDGLPGFETFKSYFSDELRFDAKTMDAVPLRKGSRVVGGTVLGKVGQRDPKAAPHLNFAIKPAGRGAHTIDPKPILDGWKLLEATAIYRAAGKNPFDDKATVGQVLLASKSQLQRRVLADPRLEIYSCGRDDVRTGQIDRRVMAMLEYLTARGFRLTITSMKCGHSIMTVSGNVSAHSTGDAVDIAQVNGIPIYGNQGKGSITEVVINELLKLQGAMEPAQIISLMDMGGPTFVMSDHADHIHVGYTPDGSNHSGKPLSALLSPKKWDRLLDRISKLDQPTVPVGPSKYSLPAKKSKKQQRGGAGKRGD